jgi:CRP-like cAMP-binding protein
MGDLTQTLKGLPLLASLPDDVIVELAGRFESRSLAAGEALFHKGEPGDALHIIVKGEVEVFVKDDQGQEQILNRLGPGCALGEMSIINEEPRTASVTALSPVEVLRLSRHDFLEVLSHQPASLLDSLREVADRLRLRYLDILKGLPLFVSLSDDLLAELAAKLETVNLGKDEVLFRKGAPGDSMYIIDSGWMKVVTEGTHGEELVLNQCGPGETVGEMSMVDEEPRSASVIAISPVRALRLRRDAFLETLSRQPDLAMDFMRNISGRLRFATTYIEKAIELSERVASGDYDFAIDQIQSEQSAIVGGSRELSDEARATKLLSAFFAMVEGVKEREENLKKQLLQITIQIDEAKRKEEFEALTQSDFYAGLKAAAQKLRDERTAEDD